MCPASLLRKSEILAHLRDLEPQIRALGVRRLALFGSFVRDASGPSSDVDLLVEFAPGRKSFDRFTELGRLLEADLGRRVELVTVESLSPYIGPHILRTAEDVIRVA
jgi:predicted nucleotidyltransferase